MSIINIVIADHEQLFRSGIRMLLNRESNFNIIYEAENGKKLIDVAQQSESLPDIILLDLKIPEIEGIKTIEAIHKIHPNAKIIVLTSTLSASITTKTLGAGICSYLLKNTSPKILIYTINESYKKELCLHKKEVQTNRVVNKPTIGALHKNKITQTQLSKREIDVLALICAQHTTSEVADKLFISKRTVEGHRNKLLRKTRSRNIAGLILYGIEKRLITI
jgi:DNA-binding NarL/FixJ family response regulator